MRRQDPDPQIPLAPHASSALANAVFQGLARPIGAKQSWSIPRMLVVGIASFGLLPALILIWRFGQLVVGEQQQLLHLARWVRGTLKPADGAALESQASRIRPPRWAFLLILLIVGGTAAAMLAVLETSRGGGIEDRVIAGTYGYQRTHLGDYRVRSFPDATMIFSIWVLGLSCAFSVLWLAVQIHATEVKRFVQRFNTIARAHGGHGASVPPLGIPLRPLWLAGAVCMVLMHAPWGVVAMLAGAAQRRYINHISRDTRAELAQRLRELMQRHGAEEPVALPVYLQRRCIEPRCRAELPRDASYCRRCGTRQTSPIEFRA